MTSLDRRAVNSDRRGPWAVLLAGGDGTRLRSLSVKIAGDSRPKQFCQIFGGKSLLTQTRERIAPLFRADRTHFVVTRSHEAYYRDEFSATDLRSLIVQPWNRGTAVAIIAALVRILRSDDGALVALFPCDHYYADEDAFIDTVRSALDIVDERPSSIVLLGAEARYPEVEYGWIEPGRPASNTPSAPLMKVRRFHEKPSLSRAQKLWRGGCLWNTFVTIGSAATFLELLREAFPDAVRRMETALDESDLESAYADVREADFSRQVLAAQPGRLMVIRDTRSGWTDLGNPRRVIDTLDMYRIEPAWLREARTAGVGQR